MKNPLKMEKTLTKYGCTYGVHIENVTLWRLGTQSSATKRVVKQLMKHNA